MTALFKGISSLFKKTGFFLGSKIRALLGGKVDETALEKLEELFFEADLGAETSADLVDQVRTLYQKNPGITSDTILDEIQKTLIAHLKTVSHPEANLYSDGPKVVLIVGVNGNGKTTSIAKLCKHYKDQNKSVLVAAADTFRAAAIPQLETWAKRAGVEIVRGKEGSDPAAVAFDAVQAAQSRNIDVVLIDTAGRLHTKTDLMHELKKIARASNKALPGAPHETLLVLDATIGQNGVAQAETFQKFTPLTGLILTKLDGTAKGGSAIAIQKKLNLPIRFIGIGEGLNDLKSFDPASFVKELLS